LHRHRADKRTWKLHSYGGTKRFTEGAIEVVPIDALLAELPERLNRRT
jgi:hypothetical protein